MFNEESAYFQNYSICICDKPHQIAVYEELIAVIQNEKNISRSDAIAYIFHAGVMSLAENAEFETPEIKQKLSMMKFYEEIILLAEVRRLEKYIKKHTRRCVLCGKEYFVNDTKSVDGLCDACSTPETEKELRTVRNNLSRAEREGLEHTLTLSQWLTTLDKYDRKCAYCNNAPYEHLEHSIPISRGGGTTAENCVPSCAACNMQKGTKIWLILEDNKVYKE